MWRITGYKGFHNYDGEMDDNFKFDVCLDSRLSEEVINIFLNVYKKHRTVVIKAELIKEKNQNFGREHFRFGDAR